MAHRCFCLKTVAGLASAVILSAPHIAAAQDYIVTDLGTLDGQFSKAHALNDLGEVVGLATLPPTDTHSHAFLWQDGAMIDLGTLGGGASSIAYGINNQTQVVGISLSGSGVHAFIWQDGQMMDLGTPSGIASEADDINDAGQVAGYKDLMAFVWEDGVWTDLGTLPGMNASAGFAINAAGEVVGPTSCGFFCPGNAFHWIDGQMFDLGRLPGYDGSVATCINDAGIVAGYSTITVPSILRATAWVDGDVVDLGWGDGIRSEAWGVNNAGQIVGYWGTSELFIHQYATLWEDGELIDLNDRIPADSGWQLSQAQDINEVGQIAGFGYNPDGLLRGFFLDPCAPADFDCDGSVGAADLAQLLGNWGPCPPEGDCPADFNNDGQVTAADLAQLLGSWGP